MDKRNALFISVMAIATILVTVMQSSFAFSAATSDQNNNEENSSYEPKSLITMSNKEISLTVPTENGIVQDSMEVYLELANHNLEDIAKCTYDIIFVWQSSPQKDFSVTSTNVQDKYYIRTSTVNNELTLSGFATLEDEQGASTIARIKETGFDKYPLFTKEYKGKNIDYFIIVDDATIESASLKNPTKVKWHFDVKFYKINTDQNHLNNKTYKGQIIVDEDSVVC